MASVMSTSGSPVLGLPSATGTTDPKNHVVPASRVGSGIEGEVDLLFKTMKEAVAARTNAETKEIAEKSSEHAPTADVPLFKKYIDLIIDGIKTIEGRVDTGVYSNLRVGQKVRFFCIDVHNGGEVSCTITKINKYTSFAEMLQQEEYKLCLPQIASIEEGVKIYNDIPNYKERAVLFGVLAIHIKKV
jgi:ASC-1-like (ASCH) protein